MEVKRMKFDIGTASYTYVELVVVFMFIFIVVAIFASLVCLSKLCGLLFYILSFHWLLKIMI